MENREDGVCQTQNGVVYFNASDGSWHNVIAQQ